MTEKKKSKYIAGRSYKHPDGVSRTWDDTKGDAGGWVATGEGPGQYSSLTETAARTKRTEARLRPADAAPTPTPGTASAPKKKSPQQKFWDAGNQGPVQGKASTQGEAIDYSKRITGAGGKSRGRPVESNYSSRAAYLEADSKYQAKRLKEKQ